MLANVFLSGINISFENLLFSAKTYSDTGFMKDLIQFIKLECIKFSLCNEGEIGKI